MRTHPVLSALAGEGIRLGLERVREFLTAIHDPHLAYPVIHVAGTNGKGSVCGYLTQALTAAGYRVGTFTSPHLQHVNERICIGGRPVSDQVLVEHIEALDRARWAWAKGAGMARAPLTYFEFVTVLAFRVFAAQDVDVAVIEVGLGGRLDATNVVDAAVCAITSIGLDHTDRLGDTLEEIAGEKAGIIKSRAPVVVGPMAPEARDTIVRRAEVHGAPVWHAGAHIRREQRAGGWILSTPRDAVGPLRLGMDGQHQGANASVAVGVLHQLQALGFAVPAEAIVEGLGRARVAGRLEELAPGLWVDGAHNRPASEALAAWLQSRPKPGNRILVFGMGAGRPVLDILAPLVPHVDEVVLARCAHPKALEPSELAVGLENLDVLLSDGGAIDDCLAEVYEEADEVIVTGSLFLVGAARSLVEEGALDSGPPVQDAS